MISQCVRLAPEILEISLKFMEAEKPSQKPVEIITQDQGRQSPQQIPSDSSSYIGQDYEHLDITGSTTGDINEILPRKLSFAQMDIFRVDDSNEEPLMDIIDDHFGKSANDFNFTPTTSTTTTMTRSADPVLISKSDDQSLKMSPIMKTKNNQLSTSEIISTDVKLRGFVEIHKAEEDKPPEMDAPPKPPKRTKTFRKSKPKSDYTKNYNAESNMAVGGIQYLYDVLYFYNHEDPILRAGIQAIICQYCRSTQAGLVVETKINIQFLLAIMCVVSIVNYFI